ncbi:unnamed protein product [Toxocara canis]|uniref:CitMHS domain-containing protein n=1 Tax=Toxocara canis TaxID=6265 RepID=A0A183V9D5_TOXCA|nr:unnamed protein product [Toxocara canis]
MGKASATGVFANRTWQLEVGSLAIRYNLNNNPIAMACAYGILVISSFWIVEVAPIAVTALLPILVFPVLGIISTKEICSTYLKVPIRDVIRVRFIKDTSMLFLCTLMISLAVEESNLHHRLALFMLSKFGGNPLSLIIGMMLVVSFISFWISDTATTVLMVPITIAILESMMNGRTTAIDMKQGTVRERLQFDRLSVGDRSLSKALILICSHGSLIGGTAVITSTGPNLVFREQIHT